MCLDCNEIITVGNSGSDGWSPVLALYEGTCGETSVTVQQLVDWIEGSGTKPQYSGNIMTHDWLAANPIYIGANGFVTDICDAVPLNGGSGSTGATGPTGPEGPAGAAGCDPNITLTAIVEGGELPHTVTVDEGGDNCNPTYDLSFPIDTFTDPVVIDAIVNSTTFQDYLDTIIPTLIGGTNDKNSTLTIGKVTDSNRDIYYYDELYPTMNTVKTLSLSSTLENYFKWNIIGNRMTLDFLLNIYTDSVNDPSSGVNFVFELKIPAGKSVNSSIYPESNAVAVTVYSGDGFSPIYMNSNLIAGTGVITTYTATKGSNYLLLGVTPFDESIGNGKLLGFLIQGGGLAKLIYRFQGQLTFTINS